MNDNDNCSAFPFDLDPITVASLSQTASSFSSANGIQVERRKEESDDTVFEGAPISLLPNAYPQQAFRQAQDLAPAFNELVDRISRNGKFLEETLGGGVSAMDPFTAKILKLYREVYGDDSTANAPAKIADRLGIHRSDYMLHSSPNDDMNKNSYQLKQVELNTIASSFACLSCKIATMHQYLSSRYRTEIDGFLQNNRKRVIDDTINDSGNASPSAGVPVNPALEEIPFAIKIAYNRYVERFLLTASKTDEQPPVVLFVVQDGETNTIDQRLLEFALWEAHQIPVVRRTLTQLHSELSVDNKDGALKLLKPTGGKPDDKEIQEIAVVYFRAGYAPTDYDGENGIEWKARLTLEASRATKCPCLGYHLAGTKKVQQELARPGVLERFFPEKNEAEKVAAMRACFAGLYSCGNDATSEDIKAIRDVLDGGHSKYVLKPQREGGGYNFYGKDLADKLRKNISWTGEVLELSEDLAEFILMQRLFPPQQKAVLMRGGKIQGTGDSISELGSFGTLVVDSNGKVIHNRYAGFLLRTKFSNVDEGGVASGFATLSSPSFVEDLMTVLMEG
eukprot:CAMPEP_0170854506 /NCGR_PEP_ID=MMETSP0734-20130129/13246_1 /TAXON_ID=186038 /ORGANISM="Fragilariopsis kerguelensis, Strain L26-C5" /LENGTH=564 /DNA_ID=CAMNT_0011225583 /DNA_START=48 /DNA_END=1740 /DNA_ORIENTATION=-